MTSFNDADLIDYLGGELPPDRHAALQAALATNPTLRAELTELETLMDAVASAPEPLPSTTADARFAAMLQREQNALNTMPRQATIRRRLGFYRYAAAAAAILFIFATGWYLGGAEDRTLQQELASNRALMLELMQDQSPSARIRATSVAMELPTADPVTIQNLGYLLRNDASANVRLAALDALRRFAHAAETREQLLTAIQESPPEVVRFELIEALVRMNETRVLPYLHEIIEADSLPQPVRDAAQMASFKLI